MAGLAAVIGLFTKARYCDAMMKVFAIVGAALLLQSCSYSYPVLARVIDGRLAFVSGDRQYNCISIIRVMEEGPRAPDPAMDTIADPVARGEAIARKRTMWSADGGSFTCNARYPVFYGSALPDMPTLVTARRLRVGQAYSVSVMGDNGSGGGGCFRINPRGEAENIADAECIEGSLAQGTAALPSEVINAVPRDDEIKSGSKFPHTPPLPASRASGRD